MASLPKPIESWRGRRLLEPDMLCIAGFHAFLLSAYFIPKNLSAKLMIASLALIVLSDRNLLRAPLPRPLAWALASVAGFCAWTAASLAVNRVAAGPAAESLTSFVLIGLVLLAGRRLLACCSLAFICRSLLVVASVSATASLVLHTASGLPWSERLVPLGRPGNAILGAGGLSIALIAAMTLWRSGRPLAMLAIAAAPIVVTLVLTQSRGPLIALLIALAAAQTPLRTQPGRLFGTALLAWALTTSLILVEPYLRAQFCADDQSFCRPSARLEIWSWAIANLAEHPLFGLGPTFRFDSIVLNHPHNSFLGMAMFFGLPALAAFIALAYAYCLRLTQAGGQLNYFCSAALVFSFAYMGTDLPNIFAFANMHYLFLWLPVAFGLSFEAEAPAPAPRG
ncbi:O-antigen ligase family protein [Bosea eneae]|uniref:O-antigen ligase family protein n=1 Tax=Bosea eneae TaxID=151454 RepID=A0ABW0IU22_9HYPH